MSILGSLRRSWKKGFSLGSTLIMLPGNRLRCCHKLAYVTNRNFNVFRYQAMNLSCNFGSAVSHLSAQHTAKPARDFRLARGCKSLATRGCEQFSFGEMMRPELQSSIAGAWLTSRSKSKVTNASRASTRVFEEDLPPFDFKAYMAEKTAAVNKALDTAIPLRYPEKIHEAMRYSLLSPGKRVCPLICISACELMGGSADISMPTACAVEIIHAASLILDDLPCMDNDDLRRGLPTSHKVFGEDIAILAGTALVTLAFESMSRTPSIVPAERVVRCIGHLSKSVGSEGCVAGQVVDLASGGDSSVTLETLEYIHIHKSAVLAESAAACGAMLGGGTEEEIGSLSKFARCLGLLHQVRDDILDVTKSTEQLGKTSGKDEMLEKATFPKLLGLQESHKFVQDLAQEAKGHLSRFNRQKAAPLYSLVDYLVYRQS